MKKLSFAIIFFVFLVAAANNRINAKAKISKQLKDKLGVKVGKLLNRVDKIAKKEIEAWKKEQEDIRLLAEVIYHENWNTDSEHLAAYYTGAVVMNRVKSDKWPNTVHDVLYQRGQYSTTKKFFTKELPAECYELAAKILRDGTPDVPENIIFQAMRPLGKTWKKVNTDYFCYGRA